MQTDVVHDVGYSCLCPFGIRVPQQSNAALIIDRMGWPEGDGWKGKKRGGERWKGIERSGEGGIESLALYKEGGIILKFKEKLDFIEKKPT